MTKKDKIQEERMRLAEIFDNVDDSKKELVEGLIDQAAYLAIENQELQDTLIKTGMVKVHPTRPEIQKPVEAAKQYRQNVNTYSTVIKTLNGILAKDGVIEEDPFDEWVADRKKLREQGRL